LRKSANRNTIIIKHLADLTEDIPDLEEQVSPEITTQVLTQLLNQITPEERLILILKYQEKQSIKDIHSSLGISESAVKMRLKRAKQKVFKLINK
jgi:RNA polymerase sigma-70 factor (ECF subfamily)